MVHRDVIDGKEDFYNVLDWRSWKLARVARSSLSAESQTASESADALLLTCLFWNVIFHPYLPLEDSTSAQLQHRPAHVIDAKASTTSSPKMRSKQASVQTNEQQ